MDQWRDPNTDTLAKRVNHSGKSNSHMFCMFTGAAYKGQHRRVHFILLYCRDSCLPATGVLSAPVLLKPGSWLKVKYKNPRCLRKSIMIGKLISRRWSCVCAKFTNFLEAFTRFLSYFTRMQKWNWLPNPIPSPLESHLTVYCSCPAEIAVAEAEGSVTSEM